MKPIRIIINWLIVIASPVWILPFLLYMILNKKVTPRDEYWLLGEKWLWE